MTDAYDHVAFLFRFLYYTLYRNEENVLFEGMKVIHSSESPGTRSLVTHWSIRIGNVNYCGWFSVEPNVGVYTGTDMVTKDPETDRNVSILTSEREYRGEEQASVEYW